MCLSFSNKLRRFCGRVSVASTASEYGGGLSSRSRSDALSRLGFILVVPPQRTPTRLAASRFANSRLASPRSTSSRLAFSRFSSSSSLNLQQVKNVLHFLWHFIATRCFFGNEVVVEHSTKRFVNTPLAKKNFLYCDALYIHTQNQNSNE